MPQLVPKNIKFLRSKIGISIKGLAELLNIDPINLYQYEKDDYDYNEIKDTYNLIDIADYFCVRLNDLVSSDIEGGSFFSNDWFELLKKEYSTEFKINRSKFSEEISVIDTNDSPTSNEEEVNEDINLRDEKVRVERKPVDRPANEGDIRLSKLQTIYSYYTAFLDQVIFQ